jgi:hypothetical protein
MGELTLEQKRALAVAQARLRVQDQQQAPAQDDGSYTGMLLPLRKDKEGLHLAVPRALSGLWDSAVGAATLPGDVYQGKTDPFSDEAIGRANDLAGFISPVSPASRGAGVMGMMKQPEVEAPSADALRAAASAGYDKARNLGVDYSSQSVADLAGGLRASLEKDGILDKLAPKSFGILDTLAKPPEGSVAGLQGIEAARRAFGNAARDFNNPTEQLAAKRIIEGLDDFISKADPASVVAGPASEAAGILQNARGNYAAAKRSDLLTGREELADLRSVAANSGRNYDNSMRNRLVDVLAKPKLGAGFNDAEQAAIEQVIRGDPLRNSTRDIANLLGGGGGMGNFLTAGAGSVAGAAIGGPVGAGVGFVAGAAPGVAAKGVQNALAKRAFNALEEGVRKRSPLYEELLRNTPMEAVAPDARAALVKFLMGLEAEKAAKQPQRAAPEA